MRYEDFIEYLNSSLAYKWRYLHCNFGESETTLVAKEADAVALLKLHGTSVNGAKLVVEKSFNSAATERSVVTVDTTKLSAAQKEAVKQMVRKQYNAATKFLNLSNVSQWVPMVSFHQRDFTQTLLAFIQDICPELTSISLDGNDIQTLRCLRPLSRHAPGIINVSLANNKISSWDELDHLEPLSKTLHELILRPNPILEGADKVVYHHEMARRFAQLKGLDKESMTSIISFDVPSLALSITTALPEMKGSYFEDQGTQAAATVFVRNYFQRFDSERQKLTLAYTNASTFSLSVGNHINYGAVPSQYGGTNRNLLNVAAKGYSKAVNASVSVGRVHIAHALDLLPKTKHNLDELTADVFAVPSPAGIVHCTLRGVFLEDNKIMREFQRVFILGRASPESSADGWPCVVLNDMLQITNQTKALPLPSILPTAAHANMKSSNAHR